jgi:hypothetical protein
MIISTPTRLRTYCLYLLLPAIGLGSITATAHAEQPPLPEWQAVEYEQKAFWATARSRLEVDTLSGEDGVWRLRASSSVVSNSEEVVLDLQPEDGMALRRYRLSKGKDQRVKRYEYGPEHILRERRNPGAEPGQDPSQWPVSNRREIPYPVPRDEEVVTDAYALMLLAARLQASDAEEAEVVVQTDLNFYRVRMTGGNGIPINVDYKDGDEVVKGRRETRAVALQVTPVGTPEEKPDFSFLGLEDEIILFFDRDSGLPLQVRGVAPRIGDTEINLKAVTWREPAE